MNVSFFQELLGSIAERRRALIEGSPDRQMQDGRQARLISLFDRGLRRIRWLF